ncbi:hypothetical protein RRG08_018218 [Elysia crispata]|uniref:Uncharacterized protein n=1 Tax=Elysia crispata TaxID=231223 RepID=A0AAE0YKS9_9GAST|nr:hypothetical protein RRG08_018218 [Elysia crispata]
MDGLPARELIPYRDGRVTRSRAHSVQRWTGYPLELIPYRHGRSWTGNPLESSFRTELDGLPARELIPYRAGRVTRSRAHSVQSWTGYPLESSFRTELVGLPARAHSVQR